MIIWLCLRWWYSVGWRWAWQRAVVQRLEWCMDTFSISELVRTWFAPFKQTFVDRAGGSIGAHIRAFIDKFISRVIGFIVRSLLIFTGLLCSMLVFASGLLFMVFWPLIPILPGLGIVLFVAGVSL